MVINLRQPFASNTFPLSDVKYAYFCVISNYLFIDICLKYIQEFYVDKHSIMLDNAYLTC